MIDDNWRVKTRLLCALSIFIQVIAEVKEVNVHIGVIRIIGY
jgi:hypothetical protein